MLVRMLIPSTHCGTLPLQCQHRCQQDSNPVLSSSKRQTTCEMSSNCIHVIFKIFFRNGKLALELIDFGRSIDMTLFPAGTSFTRVVTTEGFTCVEMQTGRSWTYQLDLYGVAGCVHCLLFGDYMKVVQKAGVWETSKVIPR